MGRRGLTSRLAGALLCAALAGCASPSGGVPSPSAVADGAPVSQQLTVPFFPDDTDQCGPSTLASVLTFWGVPATPERLKDELYLASVRGALPFDLTAAAERRGLDARSGRGTLEDIKEAVQQGRPVIALVKLNSRDRPYGHLVVITGYDDGHLQLTMHSGPEENARVSYAQFLKQWDRAGRWMLVASPARLVRP